MTNSSRTKIAVGITRLPNRSIVDWLVIAVMGLGLFSWYSGRGDTLAKPSGASVEYHVAIDGKDSNPGTRAAPLATLARARDVVRSKIAEGLSEEIRVTLHGGVYSQFETLIFGPEDSGSEKYAITYAAAAGETVTLSGGQRVTGWKKGPGEIWTTEIPEAKTGRWYFRQLFINGRRATRARTPNAGTKDSWWQITASTASKDNPPAVDAPLTVKISGPIKAYRNPADVELVYTQNNESARKRLESIDEQAQTFMLAPPHRWNPREFWADWYLSIPFVGKSCYLENAREMLDEPGEWYLDRQTGVLSYWPRAGEDLRTAEVTAPVLQKTMLAVAGTRERPVMNLHFEGLHIAYVDWPLPPWGYMAMFCCNVAVTNGPKPGHQPIEAAVEFSHARQCSLTDGGITHGGAMGICLREGTAQITIEGNEIGDLGGGGISAGWPNSAAGYLEAAPPPAPGEFTGYQIANNCVHDCGTDYFGAVGILLLPSRRTRIAHNLIYNTAYLGIGVAGSQDPKVTFDGNNVIEYNHIHDAMTTTVDGAGIYITFAQHGQGTLLRGNLIHHTAVGKVRVPSAGLYLDGNCSGCRFEQNVLYENNAAGPLIFDFANSKKDNIWTDNIFQLTGTPPDAMREGLEAYAGLEPAYRARLSHSEPKSCTCYVLDQSSLPESGSAKQFDLAGGDHGVVQITLQGGNKDDVAHVKLFGLDTGASYELKAYRASVGPQAVWGGPGVTEQMPMLGTTEAVDVAALGLPARTIGHGLTTPGLAVKLGRSAQVIWIVYQREKRLE
jgi:hypothetical protein